MVVNDIYITYEKGLDALAPYIEAAIAEVMNSFPASKNYAEYFPVTNLGNWKNENWREVRNGQIVLKPYESIDWYIERAKLAARQDGRWQSRGQISLDRLYDDLLTDPYAQKIPQLSLLVTKHDLYATGPDGQKLNFCNGVTREGAFSVVSTARFVGPDGRLDIDRFQSVVMHEFGHLIGLTSRDRPELYNQLGLHCPNGDIMEQDMTGQGNVMTQNRLRRKAQGLPPICPDCIAAGCRFFDGRIEKARARQIAAFFASGGRTQEP